MNDLPARDALTDDAKGNRVLELQVVRRVGDGTPGPGRPLFLDARRFIRICHGIEKGASANAACLRERVSYASWRGHIQKNPKYQKRLKRAEEVRFNLRHEVALAAIMAAGEKSWMAHAWLLERTCPNLYALRAVNRDQALTEKPIGTEISVERLAKYGALMLEFAKEDDARAAKLQE